MRRTTGSPNITLPRATTGCPPNLKPSGGWHRPPPILRPKHTDRRATEVGRSGPSSVFEQRIGRPPSSRRAIALPPPAPFPALSARVLVFRCGAASDGCQGECGGRVPEADRATPGKRPHTLLPRPRTLPYPPVAEGHTTQALPSLGVAGASPPAPRASLTAPPAPHTSRHPPASPSRALFLAH